MLSGEDVTISSNGWKPWSDPSTVTSARRTDRSDTGMVGTMAEPHPPPEFIHDYLSTACLHKLHGRCRETCKFCGTPCRCAHHGPGEAKLDETADTGTLGVSATVRLRREVSHHPVGTVAMIIGQAPNGRHRYSVMVPGDPFAYSVAASDLELVRGVSLDRTLRSP